MREAYFINIYMLMNVAFTLLDMCMCVVKDKAIHCNVYIVRLVGCRIEELDSLKLKHNKEEQRYLCS